MADRDSERDRRVRELMSDASKKKDQLAVLGQSQAEIQDIQSELQNHLAMQQAQDAGRLQETGVISQAAGMMMASQGDQLQGQVAAMNPGTQAMMGKYGVKPKRSQSSSHNQHQSRVISKSGDITNIKNETITNNHTDIRVTQPSIPISQPVISVAGAQKKEDGTAKFKAWLSGMFAKQQNDAEIQKKEYRKKEWNLGRTTTRLMKRIENATTSLGAKLDPKNMTSTLGGQIKWLLLIFGATMMAKFWKPTMKFLANLEGGFRAVFGLPMNNDLRNASSGTLSVIDQIKGFIGIKKGENESLIEGIGKVFMEGIDKLIDKLKFWFEDRASALKEVEFPELKVSPIGIPGFDGLMDGLTGAFKGVAQYLGDIITVAMGGSKGKVRVEANKIARQAQEVFTNTSGKQTSAGDAGLVKGNGRSYMKDSDYDMFGNLKGNAASTQAMSESLISLFNDKSNKAHTAEIGTGVSQLFRVAKRNGQVVIDPALLPYLGLTQADVVALQRNQQLRQEKYRIIGVKPTTDSERKELGAYTGNAGFWAGGVGGTLAGAWAGAKGGAALGSFAGPWGTAIGGFGGAIIGGATGGYLGSAGGAAVDEQVKRWTTNGLYPKLVKADSQERGADGSMGVPKMMWTLTKEGADQVAAKFTQGMTNTDMDLTNKEFYEKIRKIEERKKRQNGVQRALTQNLQTNDLNVAQSQYDAYNKQWYENFESNDPNSKNMQTYGHYNAFSDHVSGVFNNIGSSISNGVRAVGNFVTSERLSGKQATSRSNYLIQTLMQKSGLTKEQAAGVAGNIMRESGFVTNKWGDNHTSVGIAQWHSDRINRYNREYGAQGHLADASFEQQVDYLIWEAEKDGVMGKMRQARSSAEAANTWERLFEKSQDYAKNGNRYRIEYSAKALNSFNDSSGSVDMSALQSQNASMATYYKGESPFKIEGGTSTVGGGNVIAWIGDSHSELGLPGVVGNRLKSKFGCQYVWGAYHGYSAHSHLKNKPYHGVCSKDNKVNNFSEILNKKPGIIIVELGANDANGVDGDWKTGIPKLIDTIKGNGAKVVWLTPLGYSVGAKNARKNAIDMNKSANQVREYILSRSDISVVDVGGFVNFYSGQATPWDKFVGNDGLHWNSTGYKMLGEWIGGVLTGVVSNPGFTSEDLEKQDGIFGAISENVGEFITNLADKIDSGNPEDSSEFKLNQKLTDKQKAILEDFRSYKAYTEVANQASFEQKGAKVDQTGTYFEIEGGYRAYVDPTSSAALMGLDESDITMVAKFNPKTKKLETVDEAEIDIIKKSVSADITSLFSDYEGKGTTSDLMKDDKGNNQKFYLGSFSDIGAFHKTAQASFKTHRRGKIDYWIYPTRDRSKYAIVEIISVPSNLIDLRQSKGGNDTTIGPVIYSLGKQWCRLGTTKAEKKFTDWQPVAEYFNVKFTPSASMALRKLLVLLGYGKLTSKNGKIYKENGEELTGEEFNNAVKFGLVTANTVTGPNGYSYTTYSISAGYNQAQTRAEATFKDREFNTSNYFGSLQAGETQKDREEYFKTHQNQFHFMDGKIYGPSGVVWGTYEGDDKSKYSLFDEDQIKKTAEEAGNEGLKRNQAEVKKDKSRQFANDLGFVDRNDMADYWAKISSGGEITKEEQKKISARQKVNYGIPKRTKIAGSEIDYFVYYNESGEPISYKINNNQFQKFYEDLTGEKDPLVIGTITKNTEGELLKEIIATAANHKAHNTEVRDHWYSGKRKATDAEKAKMEKDLVAEYTKNTGYTYSSAGVENHYNGRSSNRNSEIDKLISFLIKQQKKLAEEVDYNENPGHTMCWQNLVYEDGSTDKKTFWIPEKAGQKIMDVVNKAIDRATKEATKQRFLDNYEGSKVQQSYQGIIKRIEAGDIEATYSNGQILTASGDVVGSYTTGDNGERKLKALTGEEAYTQSDRYWSDKQNKVRFYQKRFGAILEKDGLYLYNAQGTTRIKIDLDKPLNGEIKKLSDFTVAGSLQARSSKTSSWDTVKNIGDATFNSTTGFYENNKFFGGDSNDVVQANMIAAIQNNSKIAEGMDLNNDLMENMLEEMGIQTDQGITAEKRRILQIKHEKDTAASTTQTARLLAQWASTGFQTSLTDNQGIIDAIKNINIEAANTRNSAIQEALKSSQAYKNTKIHVIKDHNGRERYFELTKNGRAYEFTIGNDGSINKTDMGAYKRGENGGIGISKWNGQNNTTLIDSRTFIGGSTSNKFINNNGGYNGDASLNGSTGEH